MNNKVILATALALFSGSAAAGVVFEIETKDHESYGTISSAGEAAMAGGNAGAQSQPRTTTSTAVVEGRNIKIGIGPGRGEGRTDMVYRGERREMIAIDHDHNSYIVMDSESIAALGANVQDQSSAAEAHMREALKNVPENQRAMVEQMLKNSMPQQMAVPQRPVTEVRRTGERGTKAGYPCVKYEVLTDGRKVRELWVTDWDNVEGGEEAVDAFEDMADFFNEMMDALPDMGQGSPADDNPFAHMRELGGFPVVTREFDDDGSLDAESTLRSSRRQTIDPDAFEPPSGYKRQEMFSPQ